MLQAAAPPPGDRAISAGDRTDQRSAGRQPMPHKGSTSRDADPIGSHAVVLDPLSSRPPSQPDRIRSHSARSCSLAPLPSEPPQITTALRGQMAMSATARRPLRLAAQLSLLALLLCALPLPSLGQLEPGEVLADESAPDAAAAATAPVQLAKTAAGAAVARCDIAQSRKARSIVQELFLSQLPPSYTLPSNCPFHPSLDLLARLEPGGDAGGSTAGAVAGAKAAPLKTRLSGGMYRCTTCGKKFQMERYVDEHIQSRHMQDTNEPFVCLSDYCDVLDCFHRGVHVDALTGEVMSAGRVGGVYGSADGRHRRMQLTNEARRRERNRAGGASYSASAAAAAPLVVEHPQAHRCSEDSMALSRARCSSVLQRCFPFDASRATDSSAPTPNGEEVHGLYERFYSTLCAPLHCTPEGAHANAQGVVATRAAESRARLHWVLIAMLLIAIALFYFFAFQLRSEFGWKPHTATGGAAGSSLMRPAHLKARQQSRLATWLGMQQKRSVSKVH